MKPYSNRIKELREKQSMTQAELARAIGLSSRSTITMWENGTRRPTFENFEALADVFNVPISYIMGTNGNANGDTMAFRERLRRQPGTRMLLDVTKDATEEEIQQYVDVIKALRKTHDE